MDTPWEEPEYPARSGGIALASLRTPAGSSEPMIGATSTVCTPPHYSAGKGPIDEDDEDNDAEEDDDEALGFCIHHHQRDPWQADEIGMSQLGGAPLATQGDKQVLLLYFQMWLELIKLQFSNAYPVLYERASAM